MIVPIQITSRTVAPLTEERDPFSLSPSVAQDRLGAMFQQEQMYCPSRPPECTKKPKLSSVSMFKNLKKKQRQRNTMPWSTSRIFKIDDSCRLKMSEWSYKIVDFLPANREIVAVAFNYIDRFCNRVMIDSEFEYKLLCTTSLYIALKVHNRRTIRATTLSMLSQSEILPEDVLMMECVIMKELSYHLCPPTCSSFIGTFSIFIRQVPLIVKEYAVQRALFLGELSIVESFFSDIPESLVAFSAILNAFEVVGYGQYSTSFLTFIAEMECIFNLKYNSRDIQKIRSKLTSLYQRSAHFDTIFARGNIHHSSFYSKDCRNSGCHEVLTRGVSPNQFIGDISEL